MPTDVGIKVRPSSASDAVNFHADQVTIDGLLALLERVKVVWGAPGAASDVSAATPLPTADAAAGTTLASILAKLTADPATQTTLAAILTKLNATLDVADRAGRLLGHVTVDAGTVTLSAPADLATTLTDGRKTVTVPGTAVALAASSACKWVTVTALLTNTQQVNVGGSGVLAAVGTQNGSPLMPGDSVTLPVNDPSKVFVDARVSGEGVTFTVGS